jgi:protocatechuate 3,4-dioxygenase beta subunit
MTDHTNDHTTDHTNDPSTGDLRLTRRSSLVRLGSALAGAVGAGYALERADDAAGAAGSGPAAVAAGLVTCVLTPEQTEGPYFTQGDKVRRDVREGKRGTLLTLRLGVVDASTCRPIKGATVDIWHCDALGVYSDVAQQGTEGQTFLRGIQRANAKGVATFTTIYPGWYPGRTVHVHTRVYLGGSVVHTGQLYFSDAVTDAVYTRAPYASRPNRDPRNAGDAIFRNGGSGSLLRLTRRGAGYVGTLTMGVARR